MPSNSWKLPPGPHNVGSYQIAGRPFITGSALGRGQEDRITFPNVTKAVTVFNHGTQTLRVHFNTTSSVATGGTAGEEARTARDYPGSANVVDQLHFLEITGGLAASPSTGSVTMNVKCTEIYISCAGDAGTSGAYKVFAELTNIPATMMGAITGSGLTE